MANKQTEEQQCQIDTAGLAEAALDSLLTGVKFPVVFIVVVFSFQSFRNLRKVRKVRKL